MASYYEDETPRRRSHRKSRPVYEEEIVERRTTKQPRETVSQQHNTELIRRRDSDESVEEEVRRDFPPGDGAYIQRRTTTRDRYAPRRRSADYDYYERDGSHYDHRKSGSKRTSKRSGLSNLSFPLLQS